MLLLLIWIRHVDYSNANDTFYNTCPLTNNSLAISGGCIYAFTASIVAGLFTNKPPSISLAGINLSSSNASHNTPACQIYYSQLLLNMRKLYII